MEREILDIERNAAFVMNPARIIELWLAIHGGDPAPDEAVARQTGEILASLAFYNMASTIKDTTARQEIRRLAGEQLLQQVHQLQGH